MVFDNSDDKNTFETISLDIQISSFDKTLLLLSFAMFSTVTLVASLTH